MNSGQAGRLVAGVPLLDRTVGSNVEQQGIDARRRNQTELEHKDLVAGEVVGMCAEHHQPGRHDQQQGRNGPGQQVAGQCGHGDALGQPQDAQVEHHHRAHQYRKADDVHHFHQWIEPQLAAHGQRQGRIAQPVHPALG
ncbi:hypothetical protein LOY66_14510 [Pseudomonas viciae]|nr:hypothetical protein LOY66_14510 [Pseudomonas viciae]